jgi:two-component system, OmpR family, KDP operon response regulator KdpE
MKETIMPLETGRSALLGTDSEWLAGRSLVQPLVLVLGDDARVRRVLVSALASHGFRSLHMGTRAPALAQSLRHDPDLVLLDVGGAGKDSLSLTMDLRGRTSVPILVLLDSSREREPVELLDAGANDYFVKPVNGGALLARMRVWLRQTARMPRTRPGMGGDRLRIDGERRLVVVEGREVHLTRTECAVLGTLAQSRGRPVTEEQMIEAVWGPKAAPQAKQHLRSHIRQLRHKIEKDPIRPRHLVNDAGGGYRLTLG